MNGLDAVAAKRWGIATKPKRNFKFEKRKSSTETAIMYNFCIYGTKFAVKCNVMNNDDDDMESLLFSQYHIIQNNF